MRRKVVIAGGGTGGHLFPGIALAKALRRSDMTIKITFVGTKQGIESKILPRENFKLKTIISSGLLGKKGINRWVSWFKLPVGASQSVCFLIFRCFRVLPVLSLFLRLQLGLHRDNR